MMVGSFAAWGKCSRRAKWGWEK